LLAKVGAVDNGVIVIHGKPAGARSASSINPQPGVGFLAKLVQPDPPWGLQARPRAYGARAEPLI